ncbi:MAG TPA: hypothetical protein VM074_01855 [Solimonas sp.]|nr:hypothetical protein [Solimonas sp.]
MSVATPGRLCRSNRCSLALAALLAWPAAHAATPASGELTATGPALEYGAGPFFFANQSASANGNPTCAAEGTDCDTYALTVTLPDDYLQRQPDAVIEVRVSWPDPRADFDVFVFDQAGAKAGIAFSGPDPEVARFAPLTGTHAYQVVITPSIPLGQSYKAVISLNDGAPAPLPPAAAGKPPRFVTYTSPPGLGDSAAEPSIGWNPVTMKVMYEANIETDVVTFPELLSPAQPQACEAEWQDVSSPSSVETLDPILWTDRTTSRTFVSQLTAGPYLFSFSDDDGASWTPAAVGPPDGGIDHQSVATGVYPAGSPIPHPLYANATYFCSQGNLLAFCSRSDDGGQTFGPGVPIRNPNDCTDLNAIHGHVKVAPDGMVYVPDRACNDGTSSAQALSVSTDAGLTWVVHKLPGTLAAQKDPSAGIATDGTLYMCYEAPDHSAHAMVSTDRGESWSKDYNISAHVGAKTVRFVAAVAGDPDRAACAFIATPTAGNSESQDFPGYFYGYVATTYDGGTTWHTVNVTPDDPLQGAGGVCVSGIACPSNPNNRNLLDFTDMVMDSTGHLLWAYADGCIDNCVQSPDDNSYTDNGVIARQSGGRGMLAEFDPPESAAPSNACLAGTRTRKVAALTWRAPDDGGSPVTSYKIYRSASADVPGVLVGDAGPKTRFEDTTVDPTVETYYYTVTAQNAEGVGPPSNVTELVIGPEPVVETACVTPGVTLISDPDADSTDGSSDTDLQLVSIAELPDLPDAVVITMKVKGFSAGQPPPNFNWVTYIVPPSGADMYVAMNTGQGTPRFVYGTTSSIGDTVRDYTEQGTLDPASAWNADGTMVLVVPRAVLGGLLPGDELKGITTSTRTFNPANGSGVSLDTSSTTTYVVRGGEACATPRVLQAPVIAAPVADAGRFGGGLGLGLLLPLLGMALKRKRGIG